MSRLERWVLAVGLFVLATRLVGVVWPRFYRRVVDRVLKLPEGLLQTIGFGAIGTGLAFLWIVAREAPWIHLAGTAIAVAFVAGGSLWLLPNILRDLSHLLFFNRAAWFVRLVCLAGAAFGAALVWIAAGERGFG